MKIKTTELQRAALNWAVAKCEGQGAGDWWLRNWLSPNQDIRLVMQISYSPSINWSQGGPIIEREKINLEWSRLWDGWLAPDKRNAATSFLGPTPLIAAMRCYVASKLGDEVDVPEELL